MSDLDPQLVFGGGLLIGMLIAMFAFMSNDTRRIADVIDGDKQPLSSQIHVILLGGNDE